MTRRSFLVHKITPPVGPERVAGDQLGIIACASQLARPFAPSQRTPSKAGERHIDLNTERVRGTDPDVADPELGLHSFTLPYPNAPRTWVMGIAREALPISRPKTAVAPVTLHIGATAGAVGFWNNMPLEERRDPVPLMPPGYPQRKVINNGVNVREMAIVLGLTYLLLVLFHMVILIQRITS